MSQKQAEIKHNPKEGTVEIPVPEEVYAKLEAAAEKHGQSASMFAEKGLKAAAAETQ